VRAIRALPLICTCSKLDRVVQFSARDVNEALDTEEEVHTHGYTKAPCVYLFRQCCSRCISWRQMTSTLCLSAMPWMMERLAAERSSTLSWRMRRVGAGSGRRLESHWARLLVWCAWLDLDPAHSAHGFGQQVASLVLWFGLDDWAIDQINREATRTLTPSPRHASENDQHVATPVQKQEPGATIRYDTRCYFNVRSKADMSRLNLPHGDDN